MITNFNTVFYSLAFLVPGFILHSTISIFTPTRSDYGNITFLRLLTLSCFNYAAWSWMVYLFFNHDFFLSHPFRTAGAWGFIILIGPISLGVAWGYIRKRNISRGILQKIGFNPIHVIPTGWDWKFSRIDKVTWILVTLQDGSTVAGLFAGRSFASSEPGERDLYIEEVYRVREEGKWEQIPRNEGILISGDQIKHIEFFSN